AQAARHDSTREALPAATVRTATPPASSIDGLDIVLAGDTFDGLTSTAWVDGVRPWQVDSRAVEARRSTRLGALRCGRWLLAGLRGWSRAGLPVPAVDRHGRPLPRFDARVPVRGTLRAGDRDRGLAGAAARAARYGFAVGSSWTDGLVSVCHGDRLDPLCGDHGEEPDVALDESGVSVCHPSLAETVAVGLVSRFGARLIAVPGAWPLGRALVGQLSGTLPSEMPATMDRWLMRAVQREQLSPATATAITRCWHGAVAHWLKEARAVEPRSGHEVDGIALVAAGVAADPRPWPSLTNNAATFLGGLRTGLDSDASIDSLSYPLVGRPAVVVLGHALTTGAIPRTTSAAGSGLLCLADVRRGPVTVCCHRDRDRLRVDLLEEPETASPGNDSFPRRAAEDRHGLIVDAA
ncbi:MAG: hypothetical protein ACKOFT_09665, partial [Actinomycetota bacterium]